MNDNNARRGGEEVNTDRQRWRGSLDVIFRRDESFWRALSSEEMGSELFFGHLGCCVEKRLRTPKHETIVN